MNTKKRTKKSPSTPTPARAASPAIRDRIKELRRVPASQLIPNEKNWRTHPQAQQEALRGVIEEIGYADALIAYESPDGTLKLIDGHLRQDLHPEAIVPVLVLDVTEAEADKLLATLDPLAALAEADKDKLEALLRDVRFDTPAVQDMLTDLGGSEGINIDANAGQTDPDAVPEPPDAAITQPGDLWILGKHRLLCGDSSKPEDLDRLLDGAVIHLVNTDPPYNVKVEPRSNNAKAAGLSSFAGPTHHHPLDGDRPSQKLRAKDRPLANDFITDEAFEEMLLAWFGNVARVLLPGRAFYIWGGYSNVANYPHALKSSELYFSQAIIWDKEHPVMSRKDFMGAHEWCFYGWREGAAHQFYGPANATDLWHIKKVHHASMVHLTEKPVELAARAMEYSSKPGENVLDLFGGSGSTLIAAEQTGRHAFLMELDTLYCDVIVKRFEEFTGTKAQRVPAQPSE